MPEAQTIFNAASSDDFKDIATIGALLKKINIKYTFITEAPYPVHFRTENGTVIVNKKHAEDYHYSVGAWAIG